MTNLLTYRDVSKKLQVSERTVWDLVKSGELEYVLIGKRSVSITDDALEEYIKKANKNS